MRSVKMTVAKRQHQTLNRRCDKLLLGLQAQMRWWLEVVQACALIQDFFLAVQVLVLLGTAMGACGLDSREWGSRTRKSVTPSGSLQTPNWRGPFGVSATKRTEQYHHIRATR